MKISVTGASGFIGKPLCEALILQGHALTLLSRKPTLGEVKSIQGDLVSGGAALDEFVQECDVLYHCAGEIKNADLMYGLHVNGTRNLLSAVKKRIQRTGKALHWVQLSSTGAYGNQSQTSVVDETFFPSPVGSYEVTKTISDELVKLAAETESKFTYTIVRPTVVIGSSMPNQSVFQLASMVRRGMFFYIGKRQSNVSTYVHVDDVVAALVVCGTDARAIGETFIVSNDCAQVDVINGFAAYAKVSPPRWSIPERLVRAVMAAKPPFIRLPLTPQRVDALTIKGGYSNQHIRTRLEFDFKHGIPEFIPAFLGGKDSVAARGEKK